MKEEVSPDDASCACHRRLELLGSDELLRAEFALDD